MRLCGVCAKPTSGATIHPACQKPRPYGDALHRAIGAAYRANGMPCAECGTRHSRTNPIEAHHKIPVADGGTTVPENYEPLCRRCNAARGTRQGTE